MKLCQNKGWGGGRRGERRQQGTGHKKVLPGVPTNFTSFTSSPRLSFLGWSWCQHLAPRPSLQHPVFIAASPAGATVVFKLADASLDGTPR